jgi:hypothetical protein
LAANEKASGWKVKGWRRLGGRPIRCGGLVLPAPVQPDRSSPLHALPPTHRLSPSLPLDRYLSPNAMPPSRHFPPQFIRPRTCGSLKTSLGGVTSPRHPSLHVVHVVHGPRKPGQCLTGPRQLRNTVGLFLEGPRIQDYPRVGRVGRCTEVLQYPLSGTE